MATDATFTDKQIHILQVAERFFAEKVLMQHQF
jgi:hypothetical protein